jgi:hypothetical protein
VNPRILLSLLPVLVFFGLTRIVPPQVAILGGFGASAAVFYVARGEKLIGLLTAFGFSIVTVSAVIGLIWNSEKAYLASGPVSDFLLGPVYIGSILIGKPLVGGISRELFPAIAGKIPINAPVFAWLSVLWAGYDILHGIARTYMLSELSVGQYIIWSRVLSWPPTGLVLGVTAFFILREAQRIRRRERADAARQETPPIRYEPWPEATGD